MRKKPSSQNKNNCEMSISSQDEELWEHHVKDIQKSKKSNLFQDFKINKTFIKHSVKTNLLSQNIITPIKTSSYIKFPLINGEKSIYKKIMAAKIYPQKNIDLHGLYISQIDQVINNFLQTSISSRLKYLLVITGKSYKTENIVKDFQSGRRTIKYQVIENLTTSLYANNIQMMFHPSERQGGKGAIFIVLKNKLL